MLCRREAFVGASIFSPVSFSMRLISNSKVHVMDGVGLILNLNSPSEDLGLHAAHRGGAGNHQYPNYRKIHTLL